MHLPDFRKSESSLENKNLSPTNLIGILRKVQFDFVDFKDEFS